MRTAKQYTVDDQPAIYLTAEMPLTHFDARTHTQLNSGAAPTYDSIFALSRSWPGREILHTVVVPVSSIVPDDADVPLALKPGQPYLTLRETHYTTEGEPVAIGTILVDDRFLRFQIVRQL